MRWRWRPRACTPTASPSSAAFRSTSRTSAAQIETWKQQPGVLGLRYTFLQPHMKTWPTDGTMDWLWPAAERLGLPVALLAGDFLPLVGEIAERHPRLRLIVDHFGVKRGNKDDAAFVTMPQLLALAKHPNIAVKTTGGPQYVTDPYPFKSLQKHYHAIYDAFGPRRMFWGTDITRMPCTLGRVRHRLHRAPALAARGRQAARHGPGDGRVDRLEADRLELSGGGNASGKVSVGAATVPTRCARVRRGGQRHWRRQSIGPP